jgi:hypothetical protein
VGVTLAPLLALLVPGPRGLDPVAGALFDASLAGSIIVASLAERRWTDRPMVAGLAAGAVGSLAGVFGVVQAAYASAMVRGGPEAALAAVDRWLADAGTLYGLLLTGHVLWGFPCWFVVWRRARGGFPSMPAAKLVLLGLFCLPAGPTVVLLETLFGLANALDRRLGGAASSEARA